MKTNNSKTMFFGLGGFLFNRKNNKSKNDENEINDLFNSMEKKNRQIREKCESLEFENMKNEEQISILENDKVELEKRLNYEKSVMNQDLQLTKSENVQLSQKLLVFGNLQELPKDLLSVVNLIEKVQSDKVVFLPESKKSSKDSKFQDVCPSWSLLWKISTVLWNLVFEEKLDRTNIENEFKNQTGFGLTFCDGKMTNRDRKFQEIRKRLYKGTEVDITPHCKVDRSKGKLRIHFYLDFTNKKIVIGHCGDHIDDYLTQKM